MKKVICRCRWWSLVDVQSSGFGGDTITTNRGKDGAIIVAGEWRETTHGVLNAVSWGVMMPMGAMAARYLKVFKSANPAWFYIHVTCQASAYVVGVAGWVTGLKLGSDSAFALLLRPKPENKYRFYWNIYHHATGYTAIGRRYNLLAGHRPPFRSILSKPQRSDGINKSWLLLKLQHQTISSPICIFLFSILMPLVLFNHRLLSILNLLSAELMRKMDGFVLPPTESTEILKDNELFCIKKKDGAIPDAENLVDEVEADEEQSQDEEPVSKKRKASIKLQNSKNIIILSIGFMLDFHFAVKIVVGGLVLKDVGQLINLTLTHAKNRQPLSGSTTFNRIELPTNKDPLNALYVGSHGLYTSELIQLRRKFGRWKEEGSMKELSNL
ncbi:unnamed protein product [Lactuca virosa]|uniref:Cytochrome b561 domain-containing protein n=1 Tax=Lactuca virosa TaxID=75947 RepID=A0AAU9LS56_9ASTR|nr:unnamed protein product [Lactuca virosa]